MAMKQLLSRLSLKIRQRYSRVEKSDSFSRVAEYLLFLSLIAISLDWLGIIHMPLNSAHKYLLTAILAFTLFVFREIFTQFLEKHSGKFHHIFQVSLLLSLAYLLFREFVLNSGVEASFFLSIARFVRVPQIIMLISALDLLFLPGNNKKPSFSFMQNSKFVPAALMVLTAVGLGIRIHKLGHSDFRGDEFQVIGAAKGYLESGDYYRWSWVTDEPACLEKTRECYYDRAWPHTWMIAQMYRFFGLSELTSRVPTVFFGLLLIIAAYPITLFFTDSKAAGLLAATFFSLGGPFISLSRYTRMYGILLPLFLFLIYSAFRAVDESALPQLLKENKTAKFVQRYLPFNWMFVLLSLLLLYFNYHLHINSLVIGPIMLLFLPVAYFLAKNNRSHYKHKAILGLLGFAGFVLLLVSGRSGFDYFLSNFERRNFVYLNFLFNFPFGQGATTALFLAGTVYAFKKRSRAIVYLSTAVLFSLVFFIYIANRYASFVYTSHLVPIVVIVVSYALVNIVKRLGRIPQASLLLLIVLFLGINATKIIADRYDHQGGAVHSVAYQVILDSYDPDAHVLFAQYARTYYLTELGDINLISMESHQSYEFEQFMKDLRDNPRGWAAWESGKSYHIQQSIRDFIDSNSTKIHGRGIDDTNVEVYYFDLRDSELLK